MSGKIGKVKKYTECEENRGSGENKANEGKNLKEIMQMSMLISLGITLQIAESFIAVPFFLPGVKLGLANIVTIIALYVFGMKEALKIGFMRIFLASILRNGLGINFLFSLSGMIFSLLVSGALKKFGKMSVSGVSMAGANFHVTAQIITASFIYRTDLLYISYLPYMLLITLITGLITGYLADRVLKRINFESF